MASDSLTDSDERNAGEGPSQDSVLLAAIGYVPPLFFLPLFVGSREPFARFHGRQSLVMFLMVLAFQTCVWTVDVVLGKIMGSMFLLGYFFKAVAWIVHYPLGFVVGVAYLVVVVMGIVQAAAGREWRIPVVGAYAERLRI
jgi:uncharacterized membrane protein